LVAVGNPLRRDDGAAHRVLELLGELPGVASRAVLQLSPEMAADIAGARITVFIDADAQPGEPRLEPVETPRAPAAWPHSLAPAELVAIAERLYGFRGAAWLCRVPGADFAIGDGLDPQTEGNARVAAALIRTLVARHS